MPAPLGRSRRVIGEGNLPPTFIHTHRSGFVQKIKTITAPTPLLGRTHQAPLHRIAVHIPNRVNSQNHPISLSAANKGNINLRLHRILCSLTYSNML
jgi:hypothetical protein